MRFFSARLNLDKGILLNFKFFLVNLFQYKTALPVAEGEKGMGEGWGGWERRCGQDGDFSRLKGLKGLKIKPFSHFCTDFQCILEDG